MEVSEALKILKALSDGVDPQTAIESRLIKLGKLPQTTYRRF